MMRKTISLVAIASLLLAGCASKAQDVKSAYVSPLAYQDYSCKQIRSELGRVVRKVNEMSGAQDKKASTDSVAMGVGLVLFWPALFFISGSDHKTELAQLKGEYDALEQIAIQKNCNVAAEIQESRRLQEEREKERETEQKQAESRNQND